MKIRIAAAIVTFVAGMLLATGMATGHDPLHPTTSTANHHTTTTTIPNHTTTTTTNHTTTTSQPPPPPRTTTTVTTTCDCHGEPGPPGPEGKPGPPGPPGGTKTIIKKLKPTIIHKTIVKRITIIKKIYIYNQCPPHTTGTPPNCGQKGSG